MWKTDEIWRVSWCLWLSCLLWLFLDMTVCFLSCLLKPFRLSLKLPRFPCYRDRLKRSPAALNDITTVPRICILCSARKSSCCSSWAGSFPSMAILCSSVEWLTASSPTCRGDTATAACQPVAVPLCAGKSVTHTDEDSFLCRFKVQVSGVGRKWRLCSIKMMNSSC